MSDKKLTILGVVAAIMVIWAVVQSRISSRSQTAAYKAGYLIQGLDPTDIDSIVIGTGENPLTLKRQQGRFVVVNKDNYPAANTKLNELLTSCMDIKTTELYTDNAANHKDLAVTEETAQSVVKFLKADSSLITGVIIGKEREQNTTSYVKKAAYVRQVSNDNVYITPEAPRITSRAMSYIDDKLISVNRSNIESVTVSGPNEIYTLKLDKDDKVVLENLPAGKQLKDSDADDVFEALSSLGFEDVQKQSDVGERFVFDRKFVCGLKDSTVYTLSIAQKNDTTYITCTSEFTDTTPVTIAVDVEESQEELRIKEAKLLAQDKATKFADRHKGWIYRISESKAKNLVKKLSEIIEEPQKPEEPEPEISDPNTSVAE